MVVMALRVVEDFLGIEDSHSHSLFHCPENRGPSTKGCQKQEGMSYVICKFKGQSARVF